MLKKFINKLNPTVENLEKELLSHKFDVKSADIILNSMKVDINTLNENNETLLHVCLKNNKFRAANWLIEKGIDISKLDRDGNSVVRTVIEKGEVSLLNNMMKNYNIEINQRDKNGRSLLQDAVLSGHNDVMEKLLSQDIDINIKDKHNRNVAFDAVGYGDHKVIDKIISHEDIDLNVIDENGHTIMHNSKVLNDDELAAKLLQKGADPTICDNEGHNFLTKTALRGEAGEAILEIAIKCGCDLNKKVANNKSILMEVMFAFSKIPVSEQSRRKGLKSIAKKLVKHGLDVNAIDSCGETVLFDLVRAGDMEGCAFVLENGVCVNQQNNEKESALSIAVVKGVLNFDLIILLLQYGANPTLKNLLNKTIPEVLNEIILHVHGLKYIEDNELLIQINSAGNYMIILKEILSLKNYDYNYLNSKGDPLFFDTFLYNDIKTTQLYLKYGLNINDKNKKGHNLFYEYVLKVFEKGSYVEDFRQRVVFLLVNKIDRNSINKEGQNIFTKVATIKNCNLKMFRKLVEVTKHDYKSQDNMGRTIMHYAVFNDNLDLIELIYGVERNIQNIPDNFNVLPITYAALLAKKEILRFFIQKGSHVIANKSIPLAAKKKLAPLLPNYISLVENCTDGDCKEKLLIVQDQLQRSLAHS